MIIFSLDAEIKVLYIYCFHYVFSLSRSETGPDQADPLKKEKNFIFIRLPVLREYLERELQMLNLPFEYDFERAIDDWVYG